MLIQEIIANAHDLAGGELIKQKLDSSFATLVALNVIDTMMLELANSEKQIRGYKSEISIRDIADVRSSGRWTFVSNPSEGETINVNGQVFTFRERGIVLDGSGDPNTDGIYSDRGLVFDDLYPDVYPNNRKHGYFLIGLPTTPVAQAVGAVVWVSGLWLFNSSAADFTAFSPDDVETPDLISNLTAMAGFEPAPTITARVLNNNTEIPIGLTKEETAANFAAFLNASANGSIDVATYVADGAIVTGTWDEIGPDGDVFTMFGSSDFAVEVSGETFTGGVIGSPRTDTGQLVTSGFALDAKFCRWRRYPGAVGDRWEVLDIVQDIEDFTRAQNRGQKAIMFEGSSSPQTWTLTFFPEEDLTIEIWGKGISAEITDLNALPPFAPEFSLLAAYRVADFLLNRLLLIDKAYRDFVIAQKGSIRGDQDRVEWVWKVYRFSPSDETSIVRTREYNVLDEEDLDDYGFDAERMRVEGDA